MVRVTRILAALMIVAPTLAGAQSLADVAKAEEARRKSVDKAVKVYTNSDLKVDPTAGVPAPPPPAAVSAPATTAPGAAAGSATAGSTTTGASSPAAAATAAQTPASPQRDQAYWKARMTAAREALDRSRTFADALQSRINALTTDFVNRDDPIQRSGIEQDRKKALAELDRVKKDIDDQTKAIAAIEEEARRLGVPSGWLR